MPKAQSRQEAFEAARAEHTKKLAQIDREWNVREALPDIAPARYAWIHHHNSGGAPWVSVKVEKSRYASLEEEGEEHPTLDTVRTLGKAFPNVGRQLTKQAGTSLWPVEIKSKRDREDEEPEDLSPFTIEIVPPGSPGEKSGDCSIEWFARMPDGILIEFEVCWPWYLVDVSGRYETGPDSVLRPVKPLMRNIGILDVRYKHYSNHGPVSSVERNNFIPNLITLHNICHEHGEAHLQKAIRYASGSQASPGRHVMYWAEVVATDPAQHATAADLADTLDPNVKREGEE